MYLIALNSKKKDEAGFKKENLQQEERVVVMPTS